MPRKPVTEYTGGKGPRQRIWEVIRTLSGSEWTRVQIAIAADVEANTVGTYLQALVKAGIIAIIRRSEVNNLAETVHFRLLRDEGLEAPRLKRDGSRVTQGLAQESMWRTLRLMKGDTNARELAAHASTAANPVSLSAAEHYLTALNHGGYLICTQPGRSLGKTGAGLPARWRLKPARNTGPRPPMVCRTKAVYDPNEDKVVWAKPVTEEDAIYGQ